MAQYQLVLRVGPSPGKVFPLMKNEVTIGRDINNEIVINDAEISRKHCRLVMSADGFAIEDLGSTNGTWVNDRRISGPHQLRPGESIRLGDNITLVYEMVGVDSDATVASATAAPPQQAPPQQASPPRRHNKHHRNSSINRLRRRHRQHSSRPRSMADRYRNRLPHPSRGTAAC